MIRDPRHVSRPSSARAVAGLGAIVLAAVLQGCAASLPRQPLPAALADRAVVPGIPVDARYWGDETPRGFDAWASLPDEELRARFGHLMDRPHAYLVVSGGGADGAFGAGLLVGWTAAGTRPEFQFVTGISTGAIIAPFAFLGPAYDGVLREVYTRYSSDDLVRKRGLTQLLRSDAAMDTAPLRGLLDRYLGDAEIAAIAAEGRKGRSLNVATTNLDAARPVIWDLTKIAASGAPDAGRLIRDLILASAAIPGAFPPVRIEVEADGRRYDELHVDGGVTQQLFLGPAGLDWKRVAERLRVEGRPQIYLIRNSRLRQPWVTVEPRILSIVNRSLSSLIRTQGLGDLAQIYVAAQRDGLGFNLARIPVDFAREPTELFDPGYMRELFDRGYAMAKAGYPWLGADGAR